MRLSSFLSEHTAEYALVPDLVRRLARNHSNVVPFFFWSTREGLSAAKRAAPEAYAKIITAFPRRPKVPSAAAQSIHMKINTQLLDYAVSSRSRGISVLAGIPLVSSLTSFRVDVGCNWFNFDGFSNKESDCLLEMNLDGRLTNESSAEFPNLRPLIDIEIEQIARDSRVFPWGEAMTILREIRRETGGTFPFYSKYRPFHIALLNP